MLKSEHLVHFPPKFDAIYTHGQWDITKISIIDQQHQVTGCNMFFFYKFRRPTHRRDSLRIEDPTILYRSISLRGKLEGIPMKNFKVYLEKTGRSSNSRLKYPLLEAQKYFCQKSRKSSSRREKGHIIEVQKGSWSSRDQRVFDLKNRGSSTRRAGGLRRAEQKIFSQKSRRPSHRRTDGLLIDEQTIFS